MSKEAMKLALEALERVDAGDMLESAPQPSPPVRERGLKQRSHRRQPGGRARGQVPGNSRSGFVWSTQ